MNFEAGDLHHMRHALALAQRAVGMAAPNPAVGCVIVSSDGAVVGRGWTARGGRPHAEALALKQAGDLARGATAYITLEPCAHYGETPPCAAILAEAGIARVVAAIDDPDPRVNGAGLLRLRDGGVAVTTGVGAVEAAALNAGFLARVCRGRPLVTLKLAQSIDGRIASASNESKWITGPEARAFGHLLRAQSDAILVGVGTVLTDDPELTCRISGLEDRSPMRVVLDTGLKLHEGSKLAQTANQVPTLVFTTSDGGDVLRERGIQVIKVCRDARGRPAIEAVLAELAERGTTRLLVEGGAAIHASFLDRGLADRIEVFSNPAILGAAGKAAVDPLAAFTLREAPRFHAVTTRRFGSDLLVSYVRKD
ncbi:MAG: bifunctional diaminohydroxyphosphoribosylaminopyrimidine deaminase/5-amino-6-(5-phosphoribosylamino)uracil reductase RibD [Alphaproteobacteria bacterium]|nr:bifunctional diaminohydroxyphosphoribosylaminopyrimidine deaminase/5-amino-6-(5-phosphoribosylamino)uracil reductase RibD [Alphaproteobacteria bacterium]